MLNIISKYGVGYPSCDICWYVLGRSCLWSLSGIVDHLSSAFQGQVYLLLPNKIQLEYGIDTIGATMPAKVALRESAEPTGTDTMGADSTPEPTAELVGL